MKGRKETARTNHHNSVLFTEPQSNALNGEMMDMEDEEEEEGRKNEKCISVMTNGTNEQYNGSTHRERKRD